MARDNMYAVVAGFHSRAPIVLATCALLCAACDSGDDNFVSTGPKPDESMAGMGAVDVVVPGATCDMVTIDGDVVIEKEKDFTARYRIGEPYTRTVMLFGGETIEDDNVFGSGYFFGLDKVDAQMLAQKYADFYLCSSPGGQEASQYIVPYDLVPASCQVYQQIVDALQEYDRNVVSGGDRTSLRFEGAPLELESVTADANGDDYTDQVAAQDQDFHLVTAVEQLTGESVLSFGTSN